MSTHNCGSSRPYRTSPSLSLASAAIQEGPQTDRPTTSDPVHPMADNSYQGRFRPGFPKQSHVMNSIGHDRFIHDVNSFAPNVNILLALCEIAKAATRSTTVIYTTASLTVTWPLRPSSHTIQVYFIIHSHLLLYGRSTEQVLGSSGSS